MKLDLTRRWLSKSLKRLFESINRPLEAERDYGYFTSRPRSAIRAAISAFSKKILRSLAFMASLFLFNDAKIRHHFDRFCQKFANFKFPKKS